MLEQGGFFQPELSPCTSPHLVGHALEEDGGGRDLLLGGEEAVGEVAAVRQVQPHDAPVRLHQRSVHREVARRAATLEWADRPNKDHNLGSTYLSKPSKNSL